MTKRKYKCRLIGLNRESRFSWTALIRRLEDHERIGPPGREQTETRTSRIVRIDFRKKEIETLNSIYCYGD